MLALQPCTIDRPARVVAIGCHADDIEIGCGGTILALTRAPAGAEVTWVVLSASGDRFAEAEACAGAFVADARAASIQLHGFRDGYLPYDGQHVKDVFEALKGIEPDIVFTHARHDLHQDHRLACDLTWQTFRDHVVLEYEIPKYDGDLGSPNVFVPLGEELVDEKLRLIGAHHASQARKHWFDDELFRGLMRIRGVESATRYAEAFIANKLSLVFE